MNSEASEKTSIVKHGRIDLSALFSVEKLSQETKPVSKLGHAPSSKALRGNQGLLRIAHHEALTIHKRFTFAQISFPDSPQAKSLPFAEMLSDEIGSPNSVSSFEDTPPTPERML